MTRRWLRLLGPLMLSIILLSPSLWAQGRKPDDDTTFDPQKEKTTPTKYELSDPDDKQPVAFPDKPEDVGRQEKQYDSQMGLSDKEKQAAHDISVPQN
jgi:hypothetical protein